MLKQFNERSLLCAFWVRGCADYGKGCALSTIEVCKQQEHTEPSLVLQNDSTFSLVDVAGARGTRLSSPWIMELDVPIISAPIIRYHFCRDCRKLLNRHNCYVVADKYMIFSHLNDRMQKQFLE